MTSARFHAAGWIPAALTDALDRVEAACLAQPLDAAAMRAEVRAALRQARDALTDAHATYAAHIEALNRAHALTR